MNRNARVYALLVALLIPLFFINVRYSHDWGDDFAQYIQQAINITKGVPQSESGYIYNREIDIVARPVGFPLTLAPVYLVFGNSIKAFSITETFFLFLLGITLFFFFRKYFNDLIAVLLVLIFIYNPFTLNLKMEIMTDILFTLLIFLSILSYSRVKDSNIKSYLITGLLAGFIFSIKIIGSAFLAALLINEFKNIWLNWKSRNDLTKRIKQVLILAFTSLLVYIVINILLFPIPLNGFKAYFNSVNIHDFLSIEQRQFSVYLKVYQNFFLEGMGIFTSIAIVTESAVVIFTLIGFISKCLKRIDFVEIFTVVYLLTLFLFLNIHSALRYLFPVIPILMYYAALGLKSLKFIFSLNKNIVTISLGIFILAHYSYFLINIIKHQNETLQGPQEKASLEAFQYINSNVPADQTIVFAKPRALTLYTGRKTFFCAEKSPKANESKFIENGVHYLLENSDMPDENLNTFIEADKDKVQLIWQNNKFQLYKLTL